MSETQCRSFEEDRKRFEEWLNPGGFPDNVSPWVPPGRYEKQTHQMAWLGWRHSAMFERSRIAELLRQRGAEELARVVEGASHES